jgi:hypothetical protein
MNRRGVSSASDGAAREELTMVSTANGVMKPRMNMTMSLKRQVMPTRLVFVEAQLMTNIRLAMRLISLLGHLKEPRQWALSLYGNQKNHQPVHFIERQRVCPSSR